jgi:ABC-type transport system involved in multi-copper enzyme maturation permease subunit
MKMMLFYELKKIFSLKKTLTCIIAVILLCSAIFWSIALDYNVFETLPETKKFLDGFVGEMSTAKENSAAWLRNEEIRNDPDNFKEISGKRVFSPSSEIIEELNEIENVLHMYIVNEWPQRIIEGLREELAAPNITDNKELLLKREIDMWSEKSNMVVGDNVFYTFYNSFIKYYASFLLGFLILFFIAPVFSSEYSTRMDSLILSSKHGKRGVIIAKFIASLISVVALFAFLVGTFCLMCGAFFGFSGGETSLRAMAYDIFQYLNSPYDFTMLQFLLLSLGISLFACIGFGVFTLFISSKVRNSLTVLAIGVVLFHVPLFYYTVMNPHGSITGTANFAYGQIMRVAPLIDHFDGFVLFGNVVMLKEVLLFLLAVVTVAFGYFAYRSFKRHQPAN